MADDGVDPAVREAFETAIGNAIIEHDVPPYMVIHSITNLLAILIEEAPISRAEKREWATILAKRLHEAANAHHSG